jgi:hypothetical protein
VHRSQYPGEPQAIVFAESHFAPEAMYWRAVAHYKATNDHAVLGKVVEELRSGPVQRMGEQGDSVVALAGMKRFEAPLEGLKTFNRTI